ncbi:hypothetical protein ACMC9I_11430 [Deinococcota bacterium DY0809b]
MAHHTFHIPVMGTAFTVDTPLKIAKYGIASVVSIVDDDLLERMRAYWARRRGRAYAPIEKDLKADSRARRTAAYLDLVDDLVREDFEAVRSAPLEPASELWRYLTLLPEASPLRGLWKRWQEAEGGERAALEREIRAGLAPGRVEVNIMTKVDKPNFVGREPLPVEYNDAHAALRGFATSALEGALVLSAGFNARLYSYMANFAGFFADEAGRIKKQIALKVSDARSALTQGKFLAKKGLWVSEYRVESGLNCGGHAFASQGYLMGPILEELKSKRDEIVASLFEIYRKALEKLGKPVPSEPPEVRITAQGGVGTAGEHAMLRERYGLDSVGWGSPFLLVPEVTVVDEQTRKGLSDAGEEDLYLSGASPLGVPFNVMRGASIEALNRKWYEEGHPGSPCPKGHLEFNTEFTERPICTASRNYQHRKIKALKEQNLSPEAYEREIAKLLEKQCLCTGLAEPAHLEFHLGPQMPETGVSVCPGPNLAYFSGERTLEEMVDHIYGRRPLELEANRPHVFIKELRLYADYLRRVLAGEFGTDRDRTPEAVATFRQNLAAGARYYLERLGELGLGPWKEELESLAAQPA